MEKPIPLVILVSLILLKKLKYFDTAPVIW